MTDLSQQMQMEMNQTDAQPCFPHPFSFNMETTGQPYDVQINLINSRLEEMTKRFVKIETMLYTKDSHTYDSIQNLYTIMETLLQNDATIQRELISLRDVILKVDVSKVHRTKKNNVTGGPRYRHSANSLAPRNNSIIHSREHSGETFTTDRTPVSSKEMSADIEHCVNEMPVDNEMPTIDDVNMEEENQPCPGINNDDRNVTINDDDEDDVPLSRIGTSPGTHPVIENANHSGVTRANPVAATDVDNDYPLSQIRSSSTGRPVSHDTECNSSTATIVSPSKAKQSILYPNKPESNVPTVLSPSQSSRSEAVNANQLSPKPTKASRSKNIAPRSSKTVSKVLKNKFTKLPDQELVKNHGKRDDRAQEMENIIDLTVDDYNNSTTYLISNANNRSTKKISATRRYSESNNSYVIKIMNLPKKLLNDINERIINGKEVGSKIPEVTSPISDLSKQKSYVSPQTNILKTKNVTTKQSKSQVKKSNQLANNNINVDRHAAMKTLFETFLKARNIKKENLPGISSLLVVIYNIAGLPTPPKDESSDSHEDIRIDPTKLAEYQSLMRDFITQNWEYIQRYSENMNNTITTNTNTPTMKKVISTSKILKESGIINLNPSSSDENDIRSSKEPGHRDTTTNNQISSSSIKEMTTVLKQSEIKTTNNYHTDIVKNTPNPKITEETVILDRSNANKSSTEDISEAEATSNARSNETSDLNHSGKNKEITATVPGENDVPILNQKEMIGAPILPHTNSYTTSSTNNTNDTPNSVDATVASSASRMEKSTTYPTTSVTDSVSSSITSKTVITNLPPATNRLTSTEVNNVSCEVETSKNDELFDIQAIADALPSFGPNTNNQSLQEIPESNAISPDKALNTDEESITNKPITIIPTNLDQTATKTQNSSSTTSDNSHEHIPEDINEEISGLNTIDDANPKKGTSISANINEESKSNEDSVTSLKPNVDDNSKIETKLDKEIANDNLDEGKNSNNDSNNASPLPTYDTLQDVSAPTDQIKTAINDANNGSKPKSEITDSCDGCSLSKKSNVEKNALVNPKELIQDKVKSKNKESNNAINQSIMSPIETSGSNPVRTNSVTEHTTINLEVEIISHDTTSNDEIPATNPNSFCEENSVNSTDNVMSESVAISNIPESNPVSKDLETGPHANSNFVIGKDYESNCNPTETIESDAHLCFSTKDQEDTPSMTSPSRGLITQNYGEIQLQKGNENTSFTTTESTTSKETPSLPMNVSPCRRATSSLNGLLPTKNTSFSTDKVSSSREVTKSHLDISPYKTAALDLNKSPAKRKASSVGDNISPTKKVYSPSSPYNTNEAISGNSSPRRSISPSATKVSQRITVPPHSANSLPTKRIGSIFTNNKPELEGENKIHPSGKNIFESSLSKSINQTTPITRTQKYSNSSPIKYNSDLDELRRRRVSKSPQAYIPINAIFQKSVPSNFNRASSSKAATKLSFPNNQYPPSNDESSPVKLKKEENDDYDPMNVYNTLYEKPLPAHINDKEMLRTTYPSQKSKDSPDGYDPIKQTAGTRSFKLNDIIHPGDGQISREEQKYIRNMNVLAMSQEDLTKKVHSIGSVRYSNGVMWTKDSPPKGITLETYLEICFFKSLLGIDKEYRRLELDLPPEVVTEANQIIEYLEKTIMTKRFQKSLIFFFCEFIQKYSTVKSGLKVNQSQTLFWKKEKSLILLVVFWRDITRSLRNLPEFTLFQALLELENYRIYSNLKISTLYRQIHQMKQFLTSCAGSSRTASWMYPTIGQLPQVGKLDVTKHNIFKKLEQILQVPTNYMGPRYSEIRVALTSTPVPTDDLAVSTDSDY